MEGACPAARKNRPCNKTAHILKGFHKRHAVSAGLEATALRPPRWLTLYFQTGSKPERCSSVGSAWRLARSFRRSAENSPSQNERTVWGWVAAPGTRRRDADWCDRDGRAPFQKPEKFREHARPGRSGTRPAFRTRDAGHPNEQVGKLCAARVFREGAENGARERRAPLAPPEGRITRRKSFFHFVERKVDFVTY